MNNEEKYRSKHIIFYIIYIIANIFSLGSVWLMTNMIGFGIAKALDIKDKEEI